MKTAVLCRTNAPLVKMAFSLLRKSETTKIKFIGRDIAAMLINLIGEVLGRRRYAEAEHFEQELENWIEKIRDDCEGDDSKEAYLSECEDSYMCLLTISVRCKDTNEMKNLIEKYFSDGDDENDEKTIVFVSGHRSKGLEWPRVIWLTNCKIPPPKTKEDEEQEEHLRYIMSTRAKEIFIICDDVV